MIYCNSAITTLRVCMDKYTIANGVIPVPGA